MKFFKKPNKEITNDTLTNKLAMSIDNKQRKLAQYLNRKTSFLSGKALLFALILFIVMFGSYCLYLIIRVFNY